MDIRKELAKELKTIYNNKDFVCGTIAILRYDTLITTMLDFLKIARKKNEAITSDGIQLLALDLRDEEESKQNTKKRYMAAML